MTRWKQAALMVLLVLLALGSMQLGRGGHRAKVRIAREVRAAESKLPRPPTPMGLTEMEQFASDLRAINPEGASRRVRTALENYVAAAERHRDGLRTVGWDTNTSWQVGEAQGELRRALKWF